MVMILLQNAQSCLPLLTTWTVACQAPLLMEFSRQEILEQVAISCSRGSSQPRDGTHSESTALHLPHCRHILYHQCHLGSSLKREVIKKVAFRFSMSNE